MGKNSRTIINVICSMLVLITNLAISFLLSPYIVKNIGVEANGFVTLANNFVVYAQLIVTALNSMAARFISIAYVNKDYKKANIYYNSVFWGNLIIVVLLIVPAAIFIIKMEHIINVPINIITDVKILFGFVFFNFFITTGLPNWDCGTFISNRLDRKYIPDMLTSLLKCIVLFTMFAFLAPHVWYVGMTASFVTIIVLVFAGYNTHVLTPELRIEFKINKRICSREAAKELVGSGIWNSISNVGNMLLSGLDLIICNLCLGATAMGIVSLSKILPNLMQQLSASIRGAFAPELTIDYALGNKELVLNNINRAMKLTAFVMTVPIAIIIVLGDQFFALWVPSQDAKLLQVLSILAIFGYMFTSGTQILYNVFTVVNTVRQNAIAMLLSGIVSTTITLLIIKNTRYGIFAVAGVSSFVNLVRNMIYTLPATAKYLGFKWNQFYPQVGMTIFSSVLLIVVGYLLKSVLPVGNWFVFFFDVITVSIIGVIINLFVLLNKYDRIYLLKAIQSRIIQNRG